MHVITTHSPTCKACSTAQYSVFDCVVCGCCECVKQIQERINRTVDGQIVASFVDSPKSVVTTDNPSLFFKSPDPQSSMLSPITRVCERTNCSQVAHIDPYNSPNIELWGVGGNQITSECNNRLINKYFWFGPTCDNLSVTSNRQTLAAH